MSTPGDWWHDVRVLLRILQVKLSQGCAVQAAGQLQAAVEDLHEANSALSVVEDAADQVRPSN